MSERGRWIKFQMHNCAQSCSDVKAHEIQIPDGWNLIEGTEEQVKEGDKYLNLFTGKWTPVPKEDMGYMTDYYDFLIRKGS